MLVNIKTHKDPGEVSMRLIHASTKYPGTPLSSVVKKILQRKVRTLPHIYQKTEDFINEFKTKNVNLPDDVIFWTADIGDFFMNGEFQDLIESSTEHLEGDEKEGVRDALWALLGTQYVRSPLIPEEIYHVVSGSGMGNRQSSEVADLNFYHRVERNLISQMQAHGVLLYGRYRDDIAVLQKDESPTFGNGTFYHKLVTSAQRSGYKVEADQFIVGSQREAHFLDLNIIKPKDFRLTRKFSFNLFVKPSAQKVLLNPSSAHAPKIHENWPFGELRRFAQRVNERRWFFDAKARFVEKMRQTMFPPEVVEELQKTLPLGFHLPVTKTRVEYPGTKVYWVLPYHPDIYKLKLDKKINQIIRDYQEHSKVHVCLSWTSIYKNIGIELRQLVT